MARRRTARVTAAHRLSDASRMIELELPDDDPMGFTGGQFILVDSGETLENGRAAKRAYSVMSSDADQHRVRLAARRIGGPGSRHVNEVPVGSELYFSGPWGRWKPEPGAPAPYLVVATDTGITAALGLVRGMAFRARVTRTQLLWCVEDGDYFLPRDLVARELPPAVDFATAPLPPVGHPERAAAARAILEDEVERPPGSAFLVGDGHALVAARDRLREAGVTDDAIHLEFFFNRPPRERR